MSVERAVVLLNVVALGMPQLGPLNSPKVSSSVDMISKETIMTINEGVKRGLAYLSVFTCC
jgi:hypothetical protein